ncbi:malectin domain-containing carbohydrate-binding protein [Dyadobacter sp. NIV53]|uniref:CBM96 family carbohydrate-binding protein n=1 Tax=Dyadobacter sp. NIV53 TaxID=2861765 RepID=UPI001C8852C1|nr:malectin domain-containing carbohydrate-binding protein [Dyadobacter sp. NIV53]
MKTNLFALRTAILAVVFLFYLHASFAQDWQQTAKTVASDRNLLTDETQVKNTGYGTAVAIYGDYIAARGRNGIVYVSKNVAGKWVQIKEITAANPGSFGLDLAMDADYLMIGTAAGASIYKKDVGGTDNWGLVKMLSVPLASGSSVSIKGEYAVIGAPQNNTDAAGQNALSNSGSAFIFKKNLGGSDSWGQIRKVVAASRIENDRFGTYVSISSSYLMISSEAVPATLFQRDKNGTDQWGNLQQITIPEDSETFHYYQFPVAITDDYAVIGFSSDNLSEIRNDLTYAGSVLIYKNDHIGLGNWSRVQKIYDPYLISGEQFGVSVAIDGNEIGVSAPNRSEDPTTGANFVFKQEPNGSEKWNNTAINTEPYGYGDGFGSNVALHGGRSVGGAPYDFFVYDEIESTGAVYVFSENLGETDQRLRIMRPMPDDRFGSAVAVSGNYAVVGAFNDDVDETGKSYVRSAGAAYVLYNDNGDWQQVKKLISDYRRKDNKYGYSVAIHDTLVVVGTPYEGLSVSRGAVYVYSKNQGGPNNWGLVSKLPIPITPENQYWGLQVGYSVFVNNEFIAVGALGMQSVYIYQRDFSSPGTWNLVKNVTASILTGADHFGASVAISGDYLLVGSPDEDEDASEKNYLINSGSAYLYGRNTGGENNWGQIKKITSDVRVKNGRFGLSVSMSGDYALITSVGGNGFATIYKKDVGGIANWGMVKKLSAPAGSSPDSFGYSASLNGDNAVVGANTAQGSAYVFGKNQGGADNWGQQQKLTAAVPGSDDRFGFSVSVSGRNILVGAPYDDDDAQEQNKLVDAGSVYFFQNIGVDPEPETSFRINSGGSSFMASSNRQFTADQYFSGTSKISSITSGDILNTTDDELYRNARVGASFSYSIPVTSGTVSVVLHFAELFWGVPGKGGSPGTNKRRFNVNIEGSRKLNNYDIFAAAGGAMRARQEAFTVTVTDGVLNIDFSAGASGSPLISAIEVVSVQQSILSPIADATVRNTPYSSTNFGSAANLEIKSGGLPSYQRNVYFKFPLTDIGQVSTAKLRFYGLNSQNNSSVNVAAYGVNNDVWSETGINWDTAPASSGAILGSVLVDNNAKYYEINVTTFIKAQASGDKTASIFLTNPTNQNSQVTLNSRENTASQPQLIVEYSPVIKPVARISQEVFGKETEEIVTSKIYPNPASKLFTVEVSDRHSGKVSLQLTALSGTTYPIQQPEAQKSGVKAEIDISSLRLAEGIYVLKIQSDVFIEVVKLLVTK